MVDLGCGDGTLAGVLAAAGHAVHGIDQSEALVALARRRVPEASFAVGSWVDAELPSPSDAIVAAGEVLGYALDPRVGPATLQEVLARCARALRPGGLLLLDLAGPGREPATPRRTWAEGPGWAVLMEACADGAVLTRRIVTFRQEGPVGGRSRGGSDLAFEHACSNARSDPSLPSPQAYRRGEEVHRLLLHRPADVLAALRTAGFSARTLPAGYAGEPLPPGLTAYLAQRRRDLAGARPGSDPLPPVPPGF